MQLARVKGTVVSTNKAETLTGLKLLIVKPIDIETWEEKGAPMVAIDAVGAGEGEVVMLVSGSSSRQTQLTVNKPTDLTIAAIIDSVAVSYTHLDVYKRQDLHTGSIFINDDTTMVFDPEFCFYGPMGYCLLYTSRCV